MRHNFRLTFALVVAILVLSCDNASAQVLTVNSGYIAGPPASSAHNGTFSVPATRIVGFYQVKIDYGKLVNGAFVPMANSPGGGAISVAPNPMNGTGSWVTAAPGVGLGANVANGNITHIRARLEQDARSNNNWVLIATAVNTCP